jgi:hypothetical protein
MPLGFARNFLICCPSCLYGTSRPCAATRTEATVNTNEVVSATVADFRDKTSYWESSQYERVSDAARADPWVVVSAAMALLQDSSPRVQEVAACVLASSVDFLESMDEMKTCESRVLESLPDSGNDDLIDAFAHALGHLWMTMGIGSSRLLEYSRHPHPSARWATVRLAEEVPRGAARAALRRLARDPDHNVRSEARFELRMARATSRARLVGKILRRPPRPI